MPGTAIGIFWIDSICKPVMKEVLQHPIMTLLLVSLIYGYVGYQAVKSAYLSDNF